MTGAYTRAPGPAGQVPREDRPISELFNELKPEHTIESLQENKSWAQREIR